MKFYKKELNRVCQIRWRDACSEYGARLSDFIKKDFEIRTTYGKFVHYDKNKVVLATEISEDDFCWDLTAIPIDWIEELVWLKEEK